MNFKFLSTEKFITISIAVLAILFNISPYAYQYFHSAPADKVYVGSYPVIIDKPTYLAKMTQGMEGNWKTINKYTTEPQKGAYIYTFYVFLGHIAGFLNLSAETVFFLGRFFFGLILLATVIYFIRQFVPGKNIRIFAYFFAFFASGLGWLKIDAVWPNVSPDLWIPDAVPLVRFSYFPHMMAANTLLLVSILFIYRSLRDKSAKAAAIAGLSAFIMNFILTFHSALLYPIVFSLAAFACLIDKPSTRQHIKNILIFFAISLPSLLYMIYLGMSDPIWSGVEKQNILITSSIRTLITAYGIFLAFGILGIKTMYRENKLKSALFALWISAVLVLSHLPLWLYPMQRRFLETAFYVPLAIAASYGIKRIHQYLESKKTPYLKYKFNLAFILFMVPALTLGNFQNWIYFNYFVNSPDNPNAYISRQNIEAMEWLRQNSPSQSIVLAALENSNVLPYYANRFVYVGHGPETLDYENKYRKVNGFYANKYSTEEIKGFLSKERINYVFYSDIERNIGKFDPEKYDFLEKVYENKGTKIYKFKVEK